MSYLEISSKTGSEMIIRIQQQFFGDLHFVLQDIKPTMKTFQLYEYWKLLNTKRKRKKKKEGISRWVEDYMFTWHQAVRQQTVILSSAWLFFLLLSRDAQRYPCFSTKEKEKEVACQGRKICLTKEECKFVKTRVELHVWQCPRKQMFLAS